MEILTGMRPTNKRISSSEAVGTMVLILATMIAGTSYGQERGTVGYTNSEILAMCGVRHESGLPFGQPNHFFSARGIAAGIPQSSGLWVDGKFSNLPIGNAEDVLSQSPRQISVEFRVARLILGQASGTIKVRLNSDMLVFPGERVSRYARRQQVIDAQFEELGPILDSIESLRIRLDEGEIDHATFTNEQSRLQTRVTEISKKHQEVAVSSLNIVNAESFHDHEGAISEDTSYLMQVQPVAGDQGVFYLRRVLGLDTDIYWGERRADILEALEGGDSFSPRTPFGAYDPNSDEDCQYLRETVPPREEPSPRELASELLNQFDLVVYGEFVDLPPATQKELRTLPNKLVEVGFRVLELFKGEASEAIRVSLNTDMLAIDGENRSRYSKRQEILARENAFLRPHRERLWELKQAAMSDEFDQLNRLEDTNQLHNVIGRALNESELESRRSIYSVEGDTFHDRDGAIHPYRKYLMGLNKVPGSRKAYWLGELPESSSRIYWDEESEEVIREMKVIAH